MQKVCKKSGSHFLDRIDIQCEIQCKRIHKVKSKKVIKMILFRNIIYFK